MNKIKTILLKEWAEVFRNRLVIFTVVFLPLIMAAIPLGILFAMRGEAVIPDAAAEFQDHAIATIAPGGIGAAGMPPDQDRYQETNASPYPKSQTEPMPDKATHPNRQPQ